MPQEPQHSQPSVLPLGVASVVSLAVGLLYVLLGSESALLMLFLVGLGYVFGLVILACLLVMLWRVVDDKTRTLERGAIATVAYLCVWLAAVGLGPIDHSALIYAVAFLSSFVHFAICWFLILRASHLRKT